MKVLIEYPKNGKPWKKVKVVIHSKDLWSGSITLAHVIHPFLVKYRKYARPSMNIYPDKYHELPEEEQEKIHKQMQELWIAMIDDMIYAFYWIMHDSCFGPHRKEINAELRVQNKIALKIAKKKKQAAQEIMDHWSPIFKKWQPKIEEHEEKIKRGTRLFGEHFQSLWT